MKKERVYAIVFGSVYPLYIKKAEVKGRTKEEVDSIIFWLTGYDKRGLQEQIDRKSDLEAFFAEAKRVLVTDGAIAVWGYGDPILDAKPLHDTLHAFNRGLLEDFWPPERRLLLDGYRDVPFPFDEVETPRFELGLHWSLPELAGYVRTWSATARYVMERGSDPVTDVERSLARDWGDPEIPRVIRWPLYIRAGRQ